MFCGESGSAVCLMAGAGTTCRVTRGSKGSTSALKGEFGENICKSLKCLYPTYTFSLVYSTVVSDVLPYISNYISITQY